MRRGWNVYASVRRAGDAPPGAEELIFDVTDSVAIAEAVAHVDSLDGLVENAGIAIAFSHASSSGHRIRPWATP